jgi:hypothetical protein
MLMMLHLMASHLLWRMDDWLVGLNPFIDFIRRQQEKVCDWGGKEISIRSDNGGFVFEKIVQVLFELLESAHVLLLLFSAMLFTIAENPKHVTFDHERSKVKFDFRVGSMHEVLMDVSPPEQGGSGSRCDVPIRWLHVT